MDIAQVQKRIGLLEQYAKEIRDAKEMIKDELENDEMYIKAVEEANEANSKKKRIKEEILSKGPNQKLALEIKSNTEETSLLKEILSAELMEVYKENNIDEIADHNGETRKFKVIVKLLPRGAKKSKKGFPGQVCSRRRYIMGKINKEWHLSHKMPKNPTHEQRLVWHKEHAQNCQCREMPESLKMEINKRFPPSQ